MLLAFATAPGWAEAGAGAAEANPILREDVTSREVARREGRLIYQRSCRPCHGMLGAGDGPYAATFAVPAADLLAAGRDRGVTARLFDRVKKGAAGVPEPGGRAMPAFGDVLSDRQIWSVLLALDETRAQVGGGAPVDAAALYETRCAVCHGGRGRGDGPLAAEIFPRPRDFERGAYRFRSTASGAPARPSDVVRTLAHGLGDTAMGSFAPLGERALGRLAARLKAFAPERLAAQAPVVAPMPFEPRADAALLARGRALYDDLSCWQCHGKEGRGDGPSARGLEDDVGNVSRPANLTKRWQLKGGATAADLFRSITTGLNGTPMASYADAIEPGDRWALARYVESLGRPRPVAVAVLQAARVEAPLLPRDLKAPLWDEIERVAVSLGPQMIVEPRWAAPAIDVVEVAAAVNEREIGFLLVWDDRSRDATDEDAGAPRDATIDARRVGRWRLADQIALQFAAGERSGGLPSLPAGDGERPVVRWTWSAERAARGTAASRVERRAGADATAVAVESRRERESVGRSRWLGIFGRRNAGGAADDSLVASAATFADGRWRLLVVAERRPSDRSLPRFSAGMRVPFSLLAWDGGSGEVGRRHALSAWVTLALPGGSTEAAEGSAR